METPPISKIKYFVTKYLHVAALIKDLVITVKLDSKSRKRPGLYKFSNAQIVQHAVPYSVYVINVISLMVAIGLKPTDK